MQIQRQRHELSAPLEQPPCQQTVIGVPYRELVSPTVLVVDDEKKLRTLVREYLEREGYAVLEAADGQTALDLARTAGPDLVLLDLGLPRLPGDEVARLLRKDSQ